MDTEIQNQSAETIESQAANPAGQVDSGAVADTTNDAEFSDTAVKDADNKGDDSNKDDSSSKDSKQDNKDDNASKKTNADYARERRKAEHEKALKEARYKAIIEALDGENPYTHEKMEDEADVQEYLNMKAIEKEGKDPIADYSKFLKNKAKEEQKQNQSKTQQEEWIQNDRADFVSKHPDVNLNDLVNDEMFKSFAYGKVGQVSMDKIYTDYQKFLELSENRAKERAAQVIANANATPGKISNQSQTKSKSIKEYSKAEFEKLTERVKRGERVSLN